MDEPCMALWGKTSEDGLHPLLFHMLDAGNVAISLWNLAFPGALKIDLAAALGLDLAAAGRLLSFWTALHDLGKASPAFQSKYEPSVAWLTAMGLSFPANLAARPHGLVTGWSLCRDGFAEGLGDEAREALGRALSGHHGN
jgi:CRISPR-associated endonuclease/helicase Cas3